MNPLVRLIPAPLVRLFARPYVAGDSLAMAMDAAAALSARGLTSTLDLLAENVTSTAQVQNNLATYLAMVDAAAADRRFSDAHRPTVSLKPSSYTTAPRDAGGDGAGSAQAIEQIVVRAKERGVGVTIDMESRHWTDFTLDLLRDLHGRGHHHVGAVLQSRLLRTEMDLQRVPEGCRVRLVIGIYQEPRELALTDKGAMKQKLLSLGETLLKRGHYVELATHDEAIVRRFVDEVVLRCGVGPERYEVQMLYGVPRERLQRYLVERGVRTRLYVPFALGWPLAIAYLRRRLDEYPAMMFLVLRDLLAARGSRQLRS